MYQVQELDLGDPYASLVGKSSFVLFLCDQKDSLRELICSFCNSAYSKGPFPNGLFSKQQVTILVDGGSTHNFIQDRVTKFMNLPF